MHFCFFVDAQDGHTSLSSQSGGLGVCPWAFEAHCDVSKARLCGQPFALREFSPLGFPLRFLAGLKNTSLSYVRNSMPCAYLRWFFLADSLTFSIHAILCPIKHGFRHWVTFWNKSEKLAPWKKKVPALLTRKIGCPSCLATMLWTYPYGTLQTIWPSGTNIRHEHCFQDEDSMQWLKRTSAKFWFQTLAALVCPLWTKSPFKTYQTGASVQELLCGAINRRPSNGNGAFNWARSGQLTPWVAKVRAGYEENANICSTWPVSHRVLLLGLFPGY